MGYIVAFVLLWIVDRCFWIIWRFGSDIPAIQMEVRLFEGAPDSMGAYEFTTVSKQWGPK